MKTFCNCVTGTLLTILTCFGAAATADDSSNKIWWLNKAAEYADLVQPVDDRTEAHYKLVYALAKEDMFPLAVSATAEISKPQLRIYAITQIAKRAHAVADVETCDTSLRLAHEVALVAEVGQTNAHLVRTYFELDRGDQALPFAKALPNQTQRLFALTNVAEELGKLGRVEEALEVIRVGQPPTWFDSGRVAIARASASAGRHDDAINLLEQIVNPANSDNVNGYLAELMIRDGDLSGAEKRITEISDQKIRATRRAQLAAASIDSQSVESLAAAMKKAASRDEKLSLGQAMIKQMIKKQDVDGAEKLIESLTKMVVESPRPPEISKFGSFDDTLLIATLKSSYMDTASILQERGDQEHAAEHVRRAFDAAKGIQSQGLGKSLLCQRLVQQLAGLGDMKGAQQLIDTLDTDFTRATASADLAASLILSGKIDEGLALADKAVSDRSMGHGTSRVALALYKMNEQARLAEYVTQMPDTPREVGAFRDIGYRLVENRDLEFMKSLLPKLPSDSARVQACLGAYDSLAASN